MYNTPRLAIGIILFALGFMLLGIWLVMWALVIGSASIFVGVFLGAFIAIVLGAVIMFTSRTKKQTNSLPLFLNGADPFPQSQIWRHLEDNNLDSMTRLYRAFDG